MACLCISCIKEPEVWEFHHAVAAKALLRVYLLTLPDGRNTLK